MSIPPDIAPFLIGIWRFREARQPRLWCATYCFRGQYYDVSGHETIDETLNGVRQGLKRLRKRRT